MEEPVHMMNRRWENYISGGESGLDFRLSLYVQINYRFSIQLLTVNFFFKYLIW